MQEPSRDYLVVDEEQPAESRPRVAPGDVIADKYEVVRVIGTGGMAMVVEAVHRFIGSKVAIKFLHGATGNDRVIERLAREARIVSRMKSEHVARVMDAGLLPDGSPFCVMELLDGMDLAQYVEERGKLPIPEAVELVLQACEGLAEAHAMGVVHRDIKPNNLFLTRGLDKKHLVKVIDFGIAKTRHAHAAKSDRLTRQVDLLGTPEYMAPEHLRATIDVDARADIWALGVTLYELVTGRRPFENESLIELCGAIVRDPPEPLPPHVPKALQLAIYRCLEKDPANRFPKVGALAAAIAPFAPASDVSVSRILSVEPLTVPPIATPSAPTLLAGGTMRLGNTPDIAWTPTAVSAPARKRARIFLPAAFAGAVLLALGVWVGTRRPAPPPPSANAPSAASPSSVPAATASAPLASASPAAPSEMLPAASTVSPASPSASVPTSKPSAARPSGTRPKKPGFEDLGF